MENRRKNDKFVVIFMWAIGILVTVSITLAGANYSTVREELKTKANHETVMTMQSYIHMELARQGELLEKIQKDLEEMNRRRK